jgi:hypothetical protein
VVVGAAWIAGGTLGATIVGGPNPRKNAASAGDAATVADPATVAEATSGSPPAGRRTLSTSETVVRPTTAVKQPRRLAPPRVEGVGLRAVDVGGAEVDLACYRPLREITWRYQSALALNVRCWLA